MRSKQHQNADGDSKYWKDEGEGLSVNKHTIFRVRYHRIDRQLGLNSAIFEDTCDVGMKSGTSDIF